MAIRFFIFRYITFVLLFLLIISSFLMATKQYAESTVMVNCITHSQSILE